MSNEAHELAMTTFSLIIVFVVFCQVTAAAEILSLAHHNFDELINGSHHVLVYFYAPGCRHCQRFAPEYERVATALEPYRAALHVARVDAVAEAKLGARFGVTGVPSFVWLARGNVAAAAQRLRSARDAASVLQWMNNVAKLQPPASLPLHVTKVPALKGGVGEARSGGATLVGGRRLPGVTALDAATFDALVLNPRRSALVLFHARWCSHCDAIRQQWLALAQALEAEAEVHVAELSVDSEPERELALKYGVSTYPSIKLFVAGATKYVADFKFDRAVAQSPPPLRSLLDFVSEHAGTAQRSEDGMLTDTEGCLQAMDSVLACHGAAGISTTLLVHAQRKQVEIAKASDNTRAGREAAQDAARYVKLLKLAIERGENYIAREHHRVSSLVRSGSVSAKQKDMLQRRANVLQRLAALSTRTDQARNASGAQCNDDDSKA